MVRPDQITPHALYRPRPVISRTPTSAIRFRAPRCVTLAAFATMLAETHWARQNELDHCGQAAGGSAECNLRSI
jgi:hypothetical protein